MTRHITTTTYLPKARTSEGLSNILSMFQGISAIDSSVQCTYIYGFLGFVFFLLLRTQIASPPLCALPEWSHPSQTKQVNAIFASAGIIVQ